MIACIILTIFYNEYHHRKKPVCPRDNTQQQKPQFIDKELESFIKNEIAIAQEDIIEINSIIIDSTMILQDATQSIFENIKKYHNTLSSSGNFSNTVHNALAHLKETKDNIEFAQFAIDSFSALSNSNSLPPYKVAVANTEKHYKIKTPYIFEENNKIKSAEKLAEIQQQLRLSYKKINETIKKISTAEEKNNLQKIPLTQQKKIENEIATNIGDIVKALQFESIANEITERAVSNIGRVGLIIEKSSKTSTSTSKEDTKKIREEIQTLKESFYHN